MIWGWIKHLFHAFLLWYSQYIRVHVNNLDYYHSSFYTLSRNKEHLKNGKSNDHLSFHFFHQQCAQSLSYLYQLGIWYWGCLVQIYAWTPMGILIVQHLMLPPKLESLYLHYNRQPKSNKEKYYQFHSIIAKKKDEMKNAKSKKQKAKSKNKNRK